MELTGVQVGLDVATALTVAGASFGWFLSKKADKKIEEVKEKEKLEQLEKEKLERQEQLFLNSLPPLDEKLFDLYVHRNKNNNPASLDSFLTEYYKFKVNFIILTENKVYSNVLKLEDQMLKAFNEQKLDLMVLSAILIVNYLLFLVSSQVKADDYTKRKYKLTKDEAEGYINPDNTEN